LVVYSKLEKNRVVEVYKSPLSEKTNGNNDGVNSELLAKYENRHYIQKIERESD
jgi:hypothetical protein